MLGMLIRVLGFMITSPGLVESWSQHKAPKYALLTFKGELLAYVQTCTLHVVVEVTISNMMLCLDCYCKSCAWDKSALCRHGK